MESFCICIKRKDLQKQKTSHKTIITTPNFIFLRTTVVQQKTKMRLKSENKISLPVDIIVSIIVIVVRIIILGYFRQMQTAK